MSATLEFRSATRKSHTGLDRRLDFELRFAIGRGYCARFRRIWGSYSTIECVLKVETFSSGRDDHKSRPYRPLLRTRCLFALAIGVPHLPSPEICWPITYCANPADAALATSESLDAWVCEELS